MHGGEVPHGLAEYGLPTKRERKAAKDLICRNDLQCWGDKHHRAATRACQPLIESMAAYDYEWTDGWLGSKLTGFQWDPKTEGGIAYTGDRLKFQTAFGAWQRMAYWCHYDPTTKAVRAEVYPR